MSLKTNTMVPVAFRKKLQRTGIVNMTLQEIQSVNAVMRKVQEEITINTAPTPEDIEDYFLALLRLQEAYWVLRELTAEALFRALDYRFAREIHHSIKGNKNITTFTDWRMLKLGNEHVTWVDLDCNVQKVAEALAVQKVFINRGFSRGVMVPYYIDDTGREHHFNRAPEGTLNRPRKFSPSVPFSRDLVEAVRQDTEKYRRFCNEYTVDTIHAKNIEQHRVAFLWRMSQFMAGGLTRVGDALYGHFLTLATADKRYFVCVKNMEGKFFTLDISERVKIYVGPNPAFRVSPRKIIFDDPEIGLLIHSLQAPPLAAKEVLDKPSSLW